MSENRIDVIAAESFRDYYIVRGLILVLLLAIAVLVVVIVLWAWLVGRRRQGQGFEVNQTTGGESPVIREKENDHG